MLTDGAEVAPNCGAEGALLARLLLVDCALFDFEPKGHQDVFAVELLLLLVAEQPARAKVRPRRIAARAMRERIDGSLSMGSEENAQVCRAHRLARGTPRVYRGTTETGWDRRPACRNGSGLLAGLPMAVIRMARRDGLTQSEEFCQPN
ncbi:MAG: hypothetical protein AB7O59_06755 [Pirellulales bacterium]